MQRTAPRYGNRTVAWCVVALVLMLVAIVAPLAHAQAPLPLVELTAGSGRADLSGRVQFLVDPDDDAALLGRIAALRADPALRQAMGRAARAKAEVCFGRALEDEIRSVFLGG